MKDLHNAIAEYLTGKLGIKSVKVYNRQPERPDQHKLTNYPSVFVEFQVQEIKNLSGWGQIWTTNVGLHVVVNRKDADSPDVYDLVSGVMALMSGKAFTNADGEAITRQAFAPMDWQVDHNHDNVVDNVLTFTCGYLFNNIQVIDALTDWAFNPTVEHQWFVNWRW
jgi:hypothetical protein